MTALIVVAALTANDVFAQSPGVQAITVPPTVSNVNGSLTVTYSASFDPTPPTVSSEDTLTNETWSWSSNCSPQSGSGTVTVSYTASVPGSFSSGVSCTVTWSVVNAKTGVPDNPSTVSVSGAGTTICDFSASGFSVSVNATLTPTTIAIGESATGSASATITGTTSAAKAELSEFNPQPTYSVVVTGKPSDSLPVASINSSTGQNLVVAASASTTPDTYSVIVTATYAWTDTSTNVSYGASGSATLSETVVLPTYTLSARLTGSGEAYGSSCVVPANSGSNSSADLQITVTGPQQEVIVGIPAPSLVLTTPVMSSGVDAGASTSCTGLSDQSGNLYGSYTASDIVGAVKITATPGGGSTSITQTWDQFGNFGYPAVVYSGIPATITFSPAFTDAGGSKVAILGHAGICLTVTQVSGETWSDTADDFVSYSYTLGQTNLAPYASFGKTTESGPTYAADLTVNDGSVDSVQFDAFDDSTFVAAS